MDIPKWNLCDLIALLDEYVQAKEFKMCRPVTD